MINLSLMRNSVFKRVSDESVIRILYIFKVENVAIALSLNKLNSLPFEIILSELEYDVRNGDYIELDDDISFISTNLTHKQSEVLEKTWEQISYFVLDEPRCYIKKERSKFISDAAIKYNCQRIQIQRVLYRYWSKGMTKYALVPNFKDKGRKKGNDDIKTKCLGRPVKNKNNNNRLVITDKELNHIKHILNVYYNTNSKYTLKFTYEQLLDKYYMKSGKKELLESYPTFAQFKYHSKQFLNEKKRIGIKKYERTQRELLGSSRSEADGPGEMYQIDSTIADIYLASNVNRGQSIGRPVLYFVTDVFSRMIVGFYVGLESSSYISLMMALYYTFSNKVDICKLYGIDIKEEEWPCKGLPLQITTDNGSELISKKSEAIILNLGIHVGNTSSWRPDLKGIVEQSFNLFNINTKQMLPGAVLPDFGIRGSNDYRKDSRLNIKEFTKIIINYILFHNNKCLTESPQIDQDIIENSVPQIPIELWNWGIANRTGSLKKISSENIKLALLPEDIGVVTEKGIRYKNIYYECSDAIRLGWFSTARVNGRWNIDIKYDPRDLNYILIYIDNNYIWCSKTDESNKKYDGWFLEEVEEIQDGNTKKSAIYQEQNLINSIVYQNNVKEIIEKVENELKVISLDKHKVNIKNIKENKKQERDVIRDEESFTPCESKSNNKEKKATITKKRGDSRFNKFIIESMEEENNE